MDINTLKEYINNQNNAQRIEGQKEKEIECLHIETESTFPDGWLACKNCGKVV